MPSGPVIWLAGAALASIVATWIRYGIREERVPGRVAPAFVWGCALFFLIAGALFPQLRPISRTASPRTVALDVSASMDLPFTVGAGSRLDSARTLALREDPELWVQFGRRSVTSPPAGNASSVPETGLRDGVPFSDSLRIDIDRSGSRLAPALRAARAAGADSVIVITDGELEDREEARREAARLGLGVREVRAALPVIRTTVREVLHPLRASAGDTIRFRVELRSSGGSDTGSSQVVADSVTVFVSAPDGEIASLRTRRPDPGRVSSVELELPIPVSRGETVWRRFETRLEDGADPLAAQDARSDWIEISPTLSGPVIVSVDPDWEAGHLLPVLNRAYSGGARAYLRVGPDLWVRAGSAPDAVPSGRIRADASSSELLVVQGAPADLPDWLRRTSARHDRVLFLTRGGGAIPGTGISVGAPVEGEWFLSLPPPPSPIGRFLSGLDAGLLPPVLALRQLRGPVAWPVVEFSRDRRGDALPGVVGLKSGDRRTVVFAAEGTWRWSARTGSPRAVYRTLFSGVLSWLLEEVRTDPVTLARGEESAGIPAGWNVAPGVSELLLVVRDSTGEEIWQHAAVAPEAWIDMPSLPPGDLSFEVTGSLEGASFKGGHPFSVNGSVAELAGRETGRPLSIDPSRRAGGRSDGREGGPPVWPFALAALLFCLEWFLRRRLGLR